MSNSILSNCYVPLRAAAGEPTKATSTILGNQRTNGDGTSRTKEQLRRICLETSILSSHAGSSLVELGHTKVIAHTSITTDVNHAQVDTGVLQICCKQLLDFGMPVQSDVSTLDGRHQSNKKKNNVSQQLHLEDCLQTALTQTLRLEDYPKTVVGVELTVLQHDGSLLSACLAAATLALADARVQLYDLVTCCQVAVVLEEDGTQSLLADPNFEEEQAAIATVTLAIMPNWKEVAMWQQSGSAPQSAIDLCHDGCRTMHRLLRQKLLENP
mmetsp:Transcript_15925/g.24117  ORF Transcript_15925/g.24117 Transcript_15925/m.24117 type:complete len:270 (+) Transcript_15925:174-983(+)